MIFDKPKTGTREWAEHSRNIFLGCAHNCRYCYAREIAVRYGKITSASQWSSMALNAGTLSEKPRKLDGRIMFPTTHDILPENLDTTVDYLRGWLKAGNEILIVSKPHLAVIERLCAEFKEFKNALMFRFTIGSIDDDVLSFWEPNAPGLKERLACLISVYSGQYRTSVSAEPYLDGTLLALVRQVEPWVTDTIWIGLMNSIRARVDTKEWSQAAYGFIDDVIDIQRPKWVRYFYNALKDDPKIRWKDSIRKMLHLPEVSDASC